MRRMKSSAASTTPTVTGDDHVEDHGQHEAGERGPRRRRAARRAASVHEVSRLAHVPRDDAAAARPATPSAGTPSSGASASIAASTNAGVDAAASGERAPERTLVAVRAIAPVAAMPPKNGATRLPTPCASSSASGSCLVPGHAVGDHRREQRLDRAQHRDRERRRQQRADEVESSSRAAAVGARRGSRAAEERRRARDAGVGTPPTSWPKRSSIVATADSGATARQELPRAPRHGQRRRAAPGTRVAGAARAASTRERERRRCASSAARARRQRREAIARDALEVVLGDGARRRGRAGPSAAASRSRRRCPR